MRYKKGLLACFFLISLLIPSFFSAEVLCLEDIEIKGFRVNLAVKTPYIVQYRWKVDLIYRGDKERFGKFIILFLDSQGAEIFKKEQMVYLRKGKNRLSGTGVMYPDTWKMVKRYRLSIRCL